MGKYRKRRERLDELRRELGWEGAVLIRVDGEHGASVLSALDDSASELTVVVVAALGEYLQEGLATMFEAATGGVVDFVDRMEEP